MYEYIATSYSMGSVISSARFFAASDAEARKVAAKKVPGKVVGIKKTGRRRWTTQ